MRLTECALGSVRQLTDQAGAVTFAQNYDPYGVVTYTSGDSQSAYGFTGEQYSAETQLLYLRARYYNVNDGRFLSRDTWSGDVNRPLSLNRLMYTEGNPVNRTDHTGKCWYGDISTGEIKIEPFLEGNGPCSWFVNLENSLGRTVTTQDDWLKNLPPEVTNYLSHCDLSSSSLESSNGFWMVIKYSTYSKWKSYSTTNIAAEAKVVLGIGGGVGYTCDTSSSGCVLNGSAEMGKGFTFMGVDIELTIGLGVTFDLMDYSFSGGLIGGLGPCDVFINYSNISFTCNTEGSMEQSEFGWKRNPYEAYWVLVHTSQTIAAGGIEAFGERVLVGRKYPNADLQYRIEDSDTNRSRLVIRYMKLGIPLIKY